MKLKLNARNFGLAASLLLVPALGWLATLPATGAPKVKASPGRVLEVWPGSRIILLLPLKLGEGWNVDPLFGQAVLSEAQDVLQSSLEATGKFSVIKPYRFNPILQRAVQERRITNEQLTALVNNPTLENARVVMTKLDPSFNQAPLIGSFALEELRLSGTAKDTRVQTQVSGLLYELSGTTASKSAVVTSNAVGGGGRITSKVLVGARDAFSALAQEFVRPIEEPVIKLPELTPPPTPAKEPPAEPPVTEPEPPPVVPTPRPAPTATPRPMSNTPLPGDTSMTGSSTAPRDVVPKLPAPRPPLDIQVPDAPTVNR